MLIKSLILRYFIDLTYNGTAYHGWQIQPNAVSVQQLINEALGLMLREPVETLGSGRTDTGVHALQQVAHFDTGKRFKNDTLVRKLNSYLPKDIAVRSIRKVDKNAHARYDALSREYEYRIVLKKDPFQIDKAYYLRKIPDLDEMNQSAEILKTHVDFESFSKVKTDVTTFECRIAEAVWKMADNMLIFNISADRFLRGMVRALVGTMLDIGDKKIRPDDLIHIIESRDRRKAGIAVPAHGLYLKKVTYPEEIYLN